MSQPPDTAQNDDWAADLQKAIEKAWEKTAKKGGGEQTLMVSEIYVKGTNPISGYRVILTG